MNVPELSPPTRLLLGPGPSPVHPRVLRAMSTPLLGHPDPKFLEIMNEVQGQLRAVFRTQNPFTIAISGTGSAGMEAALGNVVEPGDTVVVGRRACSATAWPTSSAAAGRSSSRSRSREERPATSAASRTP